MVDPVRTLVGALERELAAIPGATLYPGAGADAAQKFRAIFGSDSPPGLTAFLAAHDGGRLTRAQTANRQEIRAVFVPQRESEQKVFDAMQADPLEVRCAPGSDATDETQRS